MDVLIQVEIKGWPVLVKWPQITCPAQTVVSKQDDPMSGKRFPHSWPFLGESTKFLSDSELSLGLKWRHTTSPILAHEPMLPWAPVTHSLQPVGDLLATKIFGWSQGGCRVVARRSATGRRPVADGCRDDLVVRRFWLLQVKPLCDQIDRRKVFGGRRQVADRSPSGWQLIADQLQRLQTIPTQFSVADWSPTCRRSVADRSPKRLQTFCNQKQTLKIQSPTSRRPIANRLPIAPQLIAEWLPTDRRRVGNHCPITRQYSINTRSLSAPEPMLDLLTVTSSSDINLKAISWRQFYRRYFNHRSLKLTWKLFIWYFFQIWL